EHASSRCLAREVRCVVGAPGFFVARHLRMRAQRTNAVGLSIPDPGGDDLSWRLAFLHPLLESGDHVEAVRAVAAATVRHAGHHEQTIRAFDRARTAHRLHDALVILNAVTRGDLGIAPPVILNQLAAAIEKWLEVRLER